MGKERTVGIFLPLSMLGDLAERIRQNHGHQHQQEKDEGVCPVYRIRAACSSVLAASWFRLASAASLFASARWLTAASLLASLSCSRARFRSILACTQSQRTGSFSQILQSDLLFTFFFLFFFLSEYNLNVPSGENNQLAQHIGTIGVYTILNLQQLMIHRKRNGNGWPKYTFKDLFKS
jgi:hypothetical protein